MGKKKNEEQKTNWFKEQLKNIADYFNKHWIFKAMILFIPTIWLPFIVKVWGKSIGVADANGTLNRTGKWITVIIFSIVLGVNVLSSYKAKLEKEREMSLQKQLRVLENNLNIYETVMDSIYDICEEKYDTLLEYMSGIEITEKCEKPFLSTVQPTKQLKAISDKLANCFSTITGIKKNELTVSMAYSLANTNVWKWVDFKHLHGCSTLDELINNQRSTFYQLYSGKATFLFFNSKEEAEKAGMYVFDTRDDSHKHIGSIICQKIEVGSEKNIQGTIIMSISSYGKNFINSEKNHNKEDVENTIRNVILKQFEKRISIELSDLFIREYYSQYKKTNIPEKDNKGILSELMILKNTV